MIRPNATVHQATATAIDLDKREVEFEQMEPITYDYLVIALGARVNYFGVDGRGRTRLSDVHAQRRHAAQGARPATLGGGRP